MNNPNMEIRTLRLSAAGCVIIGCVGLTVAALSGSKAVLLDGAFNLVYAVAGVFTLRVARLVQAGDNARFPLGYSFFEPLMNGAKGALVLGLSVLALFDAIYALATGGREIAAGMAVGYGVFASVACWTLAAIATRGAKQSGSPLVEADAQNWTVNALISTAVLGGFLGMFALRGTRYEHLLPYVDPTMVLVVVLISVAVPIRMSWAALMELLNRAPNAKIVDEVESTIASVVAALPVTDLFVRVIQPGRTRYVSAHVVLPKDYKVEDLALFDSLRDEAQSALVALHETTIVDLLFSADPKWGAPAS
jgi:cation diffusion facilitator family transporter